MSSREFSSSLVLSLIFIGCTDYALLAKNQINEGEIAQEGSINSANTDECSEEELAFDIEEVSVLQDAVSFEKSGWIKDAVVVSYDASTLQAGETWRVSSVDVLVMIPSDLFDEYQDGEHIMAEVFDSSDPQLGNSWTLSQPLLISELSWSEYNLPPDAAFAGPAGEFEQRGAWMRFDFKDAIPESGMDAEEFVVGVRWPDPGVITVGYSNFNRDCSKNWSDYGFGWQLNSDNFAQFNCSWPMLRIHTEKRLAQECE